MFWFLSRVPTIYQINLISRARHSLISGVKRYFGRWNRLLTCIHDVFAVLSCIFALLLLLMLLLSDFSTLKCIIELLTPAARNDKPTACAAVHNNNWNNIFEHRKKC